VSDYADIFRLNEHAQEASALEGFGKKSVSNLLQALEKARIVEARRLLYALSIPLCGQDVCARLLAAYSLNELVTIASGENNTDLFGPRGAELLATIPGIGPEKSASFVAWFTDPHHRASFDRLMAVLTVQETATAAQGNRCQGLTFVVTGDVHHYANRNALKAYIESQGGKVTGSVSKSTSFLINNDVTSTSGKNQKAQQLGIPIISEDEFVAHYVD
jgi:DNA ligase (NAD+)